MSKQPSRRAWTRGVALLTATTSVMTMRPAHSAPGDIFKTASAATADAPRAMSAIMDGESGVSTSTGAFTYSYPIKGPPGRGGMQPGISLQYSSQAQIYGSLAAGWTLSGLPIITQDTSGGRLWATNTIPPQRRYQSSLSGNRSLFITTEAAPAGATSYRARNDNAWIRYQYYPTGNFWWKALSPDGKIYTFGDKDERTSGCTIVSGEYAPVTRIEDAFSNQIDFAYEQGLVGECRIRSITWGQNPLVGQAPFARMVFTYAPLTDPCGTGIAIGSQTSYRTGVQIITGASQLDKIESFALLPSAPGAPQNWRHKRTVTLGYASTTTSCTGAHAPYRALASIQESAVGSDAPQVDLPMVKFGYGDASVNYGPITQPPIPWPASGIGWQNYNLGWGYRPPGDVWPTVEAMMLDVDGDGLVDRIVSEPAVDGTGRTLCRARWHRNRGGSSPFVDAGFIDMPTLKWATPVSASPWDGGLSPGVNRSVGGSERCALNYQRSAYRNSTTNFLGLCPDSAGAFTCPQQLAPGKGWCELAGRGTKSDCGTKTANQGDTHFAWRWMDIDGDQLPDLVGSPVTGGVVSYDLQRGNMQGAPQEPSIFGPFPACPQTPYAADPSNWSVDAYTMCGGMFPWFVYKNHGNGVFGEARSGITGMTHDTWGPLPTKILYQPIALESTSGDSSVTSNPVGQYQGVVDIDGDGFQDAVRQDATTWKVFRNNGTGQLASAVAGSPFLFRTQFASYLSRTDYPANVVPAPIGVEGLEDFNGDGLVDHWVGSGSMVSARFNNGAAFQTTGTSIDRPGPDGAPSVQPFDHTGPPSYTVCRGTRVDDRRMVDVDGDGRADLLSNTNGNLGVRYNAGGRFTLSSTTSLGQGGGFRRFWVDANDTQACSGTTRWWMTTQDFIDLDGDGVKEDVEFSPAGQMYLRSVTQVAPRRLLVSIDNQRGKTTTIAYSSMNGPAVTQAPNLNKSMPSTGWVAQRVTTADAFSNTNATTAYAYRYPHASSDPDAAFANTAAFRGFEEVTTTHPGPTGLADGSGQRTVNRYDYSVDWSGRLVATLVLPGTADVPTPGANEVRTMEKTSWQVGTLFGGDLRTFHPYITERFTCANGQTEATCTAATAPGYTRTTRTIAAKDGVAIVETASMLQPGTTNADGDRESLTTYQLDATALTFFLHPFETTQSHRVAGSMVMFDKHRSTWSPANGRQLTDEQWIDGVEANRLITTNQYTQEGNLWKVTDARGNTFENEYDSLRLFVAAVNNPFYQHHYEYEYDYGTGTKLVTRGPDWAACYLQNPLSCPRAALLRPEDRVRIDGLGRTIERWETVFQNPNLSDLQFEKTEIHSYVDNSPGSATSATHQTAIDKTGGVMRYRLETVRFDGHGRQISATLAANGSAPADSVSSFTYRHDGVLASARVPDPTANDATVVMYSFGFDSLGRPTSVRRPDSTTPTGRSGVDIIYDGVTSTTRDVAPTASGGGQIAETQTVKDRLGRLLFLKEKIGTGTYATTTYGYDPDDNVASIVDPQGATTLLVHDFAGRRTEITRGGRTWRYGYDANGNQTRITTPCSGLGCEANYTTTKVYDALNRHASTLIAPRDLSDTDRDLFVADSEAFAWDYAGKSRDRVGQWYAYAPSSTETRRLDWFTYDPRGARLQHIGWFKNAGFPLLTRDVLHGYQPSGLLEWTSYRELTGESPKTKISYDARGLTSSIDVSFDQGVTWPNGPTKHTRNVAGSITKRRTDVLGSPMTFVESSWTYDKLGRVVDQTIQKSGAPTTQVARQALTYFGNDDVKRLQHFLGATSRTFTYGYDLRHQVTSTTTSTASYFGAAYRYGTAGRLARATQTRTLTPTPAGADPRLVRNVDYVYGGPDPEQVTALTNVADGSSYAVYTYDEAGNMKTRRYPATNELFEYTYDGKDQLRRVVRKVNNVVQGSEEYWYGMTGHRTQIVKRDAAGNKTELVWFLEDVEAHYDGNGVLQKTYAHVSDGTPIARIERTAATAVMKLEYQFHGLASNTLATVAKDGTITTSFSYAPFGERLESIGTKENLGDHKRRSNDKYEDDLTGLAYYGARYYDKTLLGWTQGDPKYRFAPDAAWAQPRRRSLYAFSLGNPLRYLDPDGYDIVLVGGSQPPTMNLSQRQVVKAAARAGSFPTMESEKKTSKTVRNAADMTKSLVGRSDKKVAYFGHAVLDQPLIDPTRNGDITPGQFAEAIKGMKEQPTDVYLYGCDTHKNGFAKQLADLLPGVKIHGYADQMVVDAEGPINKKTKKPDKNKAILKPLYEYDERTTETEKKYAPADADRSGDVSPEELSTWSRNVK